MREIRIAQIGETYPEKNETYLVEVGCKIFFFDDRDKMIEALFQYVKNPAMMERDYNRRTAVDAGLPGEALQAEEAPRQPTAIGDTLTDRVVRR